MGESVKSTGNVDGFLCLEVTETVTMEVLSLFQHGSEVSFFIPGGWELPP